MPDSNFLPNLIGGVIALKIVESIDKPRPRTVTRTKVVYVKSGKPVKTVVKKVSGVHEHGAFHLDVPRFSDGFK